MKQKIIIILSILFFVLMIFIFLFTDGYNLKTVLKINNLSADMADLLISDFLKYKLLKIAQLDEVFIFSKRNHVSIYSKISPFCFKKNIVKEKIKNEIQTFVNNPGLEIEIETDDNFETVYNYFFVIYSDKINHSMLKKFTDGFENNVLAQNFLSNFSVLAPYELADYIYFTPINQKQFDFDIEEIKNIINEYNPKINSCALINEKNFQSLIFNSKIKNIDDIKNIPLYYRDKNFSSTFNNVFKIEQDIKKPIETIAFLGCCPAQVYAFKKKKFYPYFLFNIKMNSFKNKFPNYIHLETLTRFRVIQVVLDENSNINSSLDLYNKLKTIDNSAVFIIGNDFVKTKRTKTVFEKDDNKITILVKNNKIINYLKKEKISFLKGNETEKEFFDDDIEKLNSKIECIKQKRNIVNKTLKKVPQIELDFDNLALNDYFLSVKEVQNAILAANEGVICTNYYHNSNKISVILKNNDSNNLFIYSKKYKNLISLNSVSKKEIRKKYATVTRKNNGYFAKVYFLN